MCHLVFAFWIDSTRRYYSCKGPSEPSPSDLMIVWSLDRWSSKFSTSLCENRSWWLSLRALRHRLWDSTCSCSLTQSLCLWSCRIVATTPLINKNEGLHNCNVARSSLHRITCDDVSCFIVDTLQKIVEYLYMVLHHIICDAFTNESSVCLHPHGSSWSSVTSSPTIRPSVYISMVHHDDIYVFSFDWIFVCEYVLSWYIIPSC